MKHSFLEPPKKVCQRIAFLAPSSQSNKAALAPLAGENENERESERKKEYKEEEEEEEAY